VLLIKRKHLTPFNQALFSSLLITQRYGVDLMMFLNLFNPKKIIGMKNARDALSFLFDELYLRK
jgi:hypothetical protein